MAMQRKRRRRSGGNNNNSQNNPNRHYESNGPDVRIRGSAQQILEKYLQYARDAQTSGDRVKAEALFQHAEHYARIVAVFEAQKEEQRKEREAKEAERAAERAARDAERAEAAGDEDTPEMANGQAEAEVEATAPEAPEASDATEATQEAVEEKPKRRRRAPARKKEAVPEEDGVMKTLARGAESEPAAEAETEA